MVVNITEYRRTRDANRAFVTEWSAKPTVDIIPKYTEWMHSVLCKIADAVQGKILYGVKTGPRERDFETWLYEPGGKYYLADGEERIETTLKTLSKNPDAVVAMDNDRDVKAFLYHFGLYKTFSASGLPGGEVQVFSADLTPTHFFVFYWYSGFQESKDMATVFNRYPKRASPVMDLFWSIC